MLNMKNLTSAHSRIKHGRCRTASSSYLHSSSSSGPWSSTSTAATHTTSTTHTTVELVTLQTRIFRTPEEDVVAHLLRMNDWMCTHQFQEGVKVQRCCVTLVGEARLWYKSLRPINVDWQGLQNQFREQYSKIGNTREQFQWVYRNLRFICDAHQPGSYGETQILELFKNTLPTRLYWV